MSEICLQGAMSHSYFFVFYNALMLENDSCDALEMGNDFCDVWGT